MAAHLEQLGLRLGNAQKRESHLVVALDVAAGGLLCTQAAKGGMVQLSSGQSHLEELHLF